MNFIIVALPRSRTAWLANFLTTDKTFCYHEPLAKVSSYKQLLDFNTDKITGMADTGIGYFDLSIFNCKKVIIERDLKTVDAIMTDKLGVSIDHSELKRRIDNIDGLRIKFEDINDRLEEIWAYCTGLPFDHSRAELLKDFNVQEMNLSKNLDWKQLALLRKEANV